MANLINDIRTAANLFLDMRKARKDGTEIVVEEKKVLPVIRTGGFYNTVEGCTLSWYDGIRDIARKAFNELPDEVKYQLQFVPKAGEYKERAYLWMAILKPVMTDTQYHTAMRAIIGWYIHIIKERKENAA